MPLYLWYLVVDAPGWPVSEGFKERRRRRPKKDMDTFGGKSFPATADNPNPKRQALNPKNRDPSIAAR